MRIRGVDLAARYSAWVDLDSDGTVAAQGDSLDGRPVSTVCTEGLGGVDVLMIEDVPPRIQFTGIVKTVCRAQGRIFERLTDDQLSRTFLVPPGPWQTYQKVSRKSLKETEAVAASLGYVPPDLLSVHGDRLEGLKGPARQKVRGILLKARTDYVDAFLIAEWGQRRFHEIHTYLTVSHWDPESRDFVRFTREE